VCRHALRAFLSAVIASLYARVRELPRFDFACRPFEWMKDFPPVAESSPELRDKIYNKYKKIIEA